MFNRWELLWHFFLRSVASRTTKRFKKVNPLGSTVLYSIHLSLRSSGSLNTAGQNLDHKCIRYEIDQFFSSVGWWFFIRQISLYQCSSSRGVWIRYSQANYSHEATEAMCDEAGNEDVREKSRPLAICTYYKHGLWFIVHVYNSSHNQFQSLNLAAVPVNSPKRDLQGSIFRGGRNYKYEGF